MSTIENDTAPYAAIGAVTSLLESNRTRPLDRFDAEALAKLGVSNTVIPRTIQTLGWLGLTNPDGTPSDTMLQLRRARSDEYPTLMQEVIRGRYADVFQYWEPGEPTAKLDDVFRHYTPMTMRPRMIRLFLGLCAYAGMISDNEAPRRVATGANRRSRGQAKPAVANDDQQPTVTLSKPGAPRSIEHPLIRGLIDTLPAYVGDGWPRESREAWVKLAEASFTVLYPDTESGRKEGSAG